ncbi:LysR substrate-binding domain-containing protein [Streptomyces sp. NPDC048462]|uniref:LysR family transcriptional regulator n=1 Tax=Streptomyces sp. NPDC048462 TaxID=3365555 RepID=UPI00371EDA3E
MANLQQFRTLHTVHSCGGIHAAAKALHLSPSAVSQQIKVLGAECGFPLLEPEGRGIRFTDRGSVMAQVASQIADLWETSVSRHQDTGTAQPRTKPTVSLGSFPSAMGSCVLPALGGGDDLPFRLHVFETSPHEGRDLVRAGSLDAAVSVQEAAEDEDVRFRTVPLRHEPFVLVGPPNLLSTAIRSGAESLSMLPWVLPRTGSDCDRLVTTHFTRYGVLAHPVGRTDDWALAQEMAFALQAITYVPSSALIRRDGLTRSMDTAGIPAPSRTIVLVTKASAGASSWSVILQQRLKRAYTRTSGFAHSG